MSVLKEVLARRADMMEISLNSLLVQVLWTYMEEKEAQVAMKGDINRGTDKRKKP